jgi:RNA polymerase sigma-70 factor (ECF subfamily)
MMASGEGQARAGAARAAGDLSGVAAPRVNGTDEDSPRPGDERAEPDPGGRDEDALVEAARHDRAAFGELYDRYFDAVYHYVACRVDDEQVAEDLAATVWEKALRAIERYELRGSPFLAWLYRIAGNQVVNHYRRRRLRQWVHLTDRESDGDRSGRLEERTAVRSAYEHLSDADQEILGLFYYAGLAAGEIAQVIGSSEAAVHKRLQRARDRLRVLLEGESDVGSRRA